MFLPWMTTFHIINSYLLLVIIVLVDGNRVETKGLPMDWTLFFEIMLYSGLVLVSDWLWFSRLMIVVHCMKLGLNLQIIIIIRFFIRRWCCYVFWLSFAIKCVLLVIDISARICFIFLFPVLAWLPWVCVIGCFPVLRVHVASVLPPWSWVLFLHRVWYTYAYIFLNVLELFGYLLFEMSLVVVSLRLLPGWLFPACYLWIHYYFLPHRCEWLIV